MEFKVKHGALETIKSGCLVVAIADARGLTGPAAQLDAACSGMLSAAVKHGDISGKQGQTLMLFSLPGIAAARVLLRATTLREHHFIHINAGRSLRQRRSL